MSSEVHILSNSGTNGNHKKSGGEDWIIVDDDSSLKQPIKTSPKTEQQQQQQANNSNEFNKKHIIIEEDEEDVDDMIVSTSPITTNTIVPTTTIATRPHPPLDLSIVKELISILPSHPSSNIYRAVYHSWNNMDKALQMLLDGVLLPPIEPSSKSPENNKTNINTNNNNSNIIKSPPPSLHTPILPERKDKGKGKVIDVDADDEQQRLWVEMQRKKKQEEESLRAIEALLQAERGGDVLRSSASGGRKTREEEERESEEFIRQMLLEEQQMVANKKREEELSESALRDFLRAEQEKEREDKESEEVIKRLLKAEQDADQQRQKAETESQEAIRLMLLVEQEERLKAEQKNDMALKALLEVERKERQKELDAKTYSCAICYSDCKIEEMYTLEDCYHRFCYDCLRGHFRTQVTEGQTRTIRCPDPKCKHIVTYEEVRHVLDPETFAKYEDFLLRAVLGDDPNSRWCPRPNCGNAMIGTPLNPMIVCPSDKCRFAFCFNCREAWHADATCEQYQQWKTENNESEQRFQNWAKANTKDCPKCKSNIEKNGGCNHMTCASCKYQFCWLCKEKYASGHFSNGKCQQYT